MVGPAAEDSSAPIGATQILTQEMALRDFLWPSLLQRLEFVAVFAVAHGPAGGSDFLAQGVGAGEILRLFRAPALFGEGGDFGRNARHRSSHLQIQAEC